MADFTTNKVNGDTVDASEWNQFADIDNAVITSGQTPSTGNLNQIGNAMANYSAQGSVYGTDSGVADAYVITQISPFRAPTALVDGLTIKFRPANTNTTASTVNPFGLGVTAIKKADGTTSVDAGQIVSTSDVELRYDAGNAVFVIKDFPAASETVAGVALLPKQITIANNVTDANNDIDFSAGNFQFDDGTGIASLSAITGQIDALFGTGNGMLDTGSKANNTSYYLFAVYNPTTGISKVLCSASKTSPTMPSGYTKKSYVGALRTDGSGNIRTGKYSYGKEDYRFIYNQPVLDVNEAPAATTVQTKTITAPALTFPIMPVYLLSSGVGGVNRYILLTTTSSTDLAPDSSNFDVAINQGINEAENNVSLVDYIQLSTSSQLRYRVNTTTCTLSILTRGWTEYLN